MTYKVSIISTQAFSIINFRGALIKAMVAKGIQVYAFAPDYEKDTHLKVIGLGAIPVDYNMSRTTVSPFLDVLNTINLLKKLKSLHIDVTLTYFIKPVIFGNIAAYFAGVKRQYAMIEGAGYVFTEADNPRKALSKKILKFIVMLLYKISLKTVIKLFVLNKDDERLFIDSGMINANKVKRIPGIGLDLESFSYKSRDISKAALTFVMVARLLREKGVGEYVQAARQVKMTHPDVKFVLLGGVDENPTSYTKDQVMEWVDDGLIDWVGHVNDVKPWLERANVFVLPSYYREGLPRSTQEAMAMGMPVITTDVPGCRETVDDGINGFLIQPRDVQGLVEAILKLVDDPTLVEKMGRASRKIAEENYNVHIINQEIFAVMGL